MSIVFNRDEPSTWASPELYASPDFDLVGYQNRINEIMGVSETGHPIVRLVWAADRKKCYSKFYTAWDAGGMGIKHELRAKYLYASIRIPGTQDIIDIPPPRWIFEQYNHPGQYMASWEATRFTDGKEVRPAPPPNGYYSDLHVIALHKHDECCKDAKEKKVVCWGMYRAPDEKDLEMLRAAKQARDADPFIDPSKPLDEKTLARIEEESAAIKEKFEAKREETLKEFVDENAIDLLQLCGVPVSGRARKIFSIPTALRGKKEKTESGIIVPYKT